jgi:N-acyl homoserine lactone hydrolase
VIFDTGLHRELQHNNSRIGPLAKAFTIEFHAGDELAERLAARGVDPARIDCMINSHLHFDHVGGPAQGEAGGAASRVGGCGGSRSDSPQRI